MVKVEHLKLMPPNHIFATGEGEFPEIHQGMIRWIAVKSNQNDWCIKVAPANLNKEQVRKHGKIVDVPRLINQILPTSEGAMALYRK